MPVGDVVVGFIEESFAEGEEGEAVGFIEGFEGVSGDAIESWGFPEGEFVEGGHEL